MPGMPRLLIVKTTSLGDVIHNLPVIQDIHHHRPDWRVDWLVEESFADIPRLHPGVDRVITVAMRHWRGQLFTASTWRQIGALKRTLRATDYDLVLDTQGLLKSALLARLARAPHHGYQRDSIREPIAARLYDVRHAVPKNQHAVARIRQLAALALGYDAPQSPPDYGIHVQPGAELALPAAYVVGLHGTSRIAKLWPTAHWIALAHELHEQRLALVLPWGSETERARALHIAASTPQTVVLPRASLSTLAAVLAAAHAAIGVDTGLMHLAVALRTPSFALYTDTDPALTGLYPAANGTAVNLGGKNRLPSVAELMAQLAAHAIVPKIRPLQA